MLGFEDNRSKSAQESSANEEFNDSSDALSANQPSTSKKMAQHVVSRVHMAPEEVCKQGHVIGQKKSTQQTQD